MLRASFDHDPCDKREVHQAEAFYNDIRRWGGIELARGRFSQMHLRLKS